MTQKIGTIFNFNQMPDVSKFPFVINNRNGKDMVKKGLFVYTRTAEGFLIGIVEKIALLNEYFSDALTIKAYNENNPNILKGLFPSDDFEFAIAIIKALGIIEFKDSSKKEIKKIVRMTYPASPGADVYLVEEDILNLLMGFNNQGLHIGKVKTSNFEAKININRLLNKHFAILSISGGGKSYLTSILIEELLERDNSYGTPAIILIDVHGEYSYLKDIPQLKNKVKVQDISYFQISLPKLNGWAIRK